MLAGSRMADAPGGRRPAARAFTLIELLLVVLILGVMVAAIVPRLGGLLEGSKASIAARGVARVGRYARTMALLNQMPMELVLDLDKPSIAVEAVTSKASGGGSAMWDEGGGGGGGGFGQAVSRDDRVATERQLGFRGTGNAGAVAGTVGGRAADMAAAMAADAAAEESGGGFADAIALVQQLEGVQLRFGGYVDRTDLQDADASTNGTVRIRYRTNGTCRPHRIEVVTSRTEERFIVDVDAVGTPFLAQGEDELQRRGQR